MASIDGDWFHSRSSSNLDELLAVRRLLIESQKPEYIGFGWSGGRFNNEKMYKFAATAGIEPSTMQTKIRAMIRYGFVKDDNHCPIQWTRLGQLWNDLYSIGNQEAAQIIYEITLIVSLAIYAFTDSKNGYTNNPSKGQLPLKTLLNLLNNNSITFREFEILVDGNTKRTGKNTSYWKCDLINAGLFSENEHILTYTGKYWEFVQDIKNFTPNSLLNDYEWTEIRENPLHQNSPFQNTLKQIFLNISEQQTIKEQIGAEIMTEPIIEIVSQAEDYLIPDVDIISKETQIVTTNHRVRSSIWATRVKREYEYKCVVPNCDVVGNPFVVSAHIKPDSIPEIDLPHRTHILNGLCLCYHCHIAFDKGFISLSDNNKLLVSKEFAKNITDQYLKRMILASENKEIKNRIDERKPILEFVNYHRTNIFHY